MSCCFPECSQSIDILPKDEVHSTSLRHPLTYSACCREACRLRPRDPDPLGASLTQREYHRLAPVNHGQTILGRRYGSKARQLHSQVCFLFPPNSPCSMFCETFRKYAATFAAYERNTGSRHPLDTVARSSSTSASKPAGSRGERLEDDQSFMWYGPIDIGTPSQRFESEMSSIVSRLAF